MSLPEPITTYQVDGNANQLHSLPLSSSPQPTNGSLATTAFKGGFDQRDTSSPPASPVEMDGTFFIARYSYQARTAEDLSFEKGEKLKVIGAADGDWWMAKSLANSKEGYIPRNYVAPLASYEAEE